MQEMSKTNKVGLSAMKAGMNRKTARKYIAGEKLPSAFEKERDWTTRKDPFLQDWAAIEKMLKGSPALEAKTVFGELIEKYPKRYEPGQLRTLQRKVRVWRAKEGAEKEVFFTQAHIAGEAAQTDFTHATELGVTIMREAYPHMLCVFVLPYSNWQWATVCTSESLLAIRKGVQAALFQLGRVPKFHQTDNSTSATHRVPLEQQEDEDVQKRRFNKEYIALMDHFGMKPRTTKIGESQQNGDVESSNGALKRRLAQRLILRGSLDFNSIAEWEGFIHTELRKTNATRERRVTVELAAMTEINVEKLREYNEEEVTVSQGSTVRIKQATYSVPSRLMGHRVRARIFESRIEVYFADKIQLSCERRLAKGHCINYRHVIWSLVKKPGAFHRYVYRDEMFPSTHFRRCYDSIHALTPGVRGDADYLKILHLAASTSETDVEAALDLLLSERRRISVDTIKALIAGESSTNIPHLDKLIPDLKSYDYLLMEAVND